MIEQELFDRISSRKPQPPAGFAARHDRLLQRIVTGKEEKYMRKQRMLRVALIAALIVMTTGAALAAMHGFGLIDLMQQHGHRVEEKQLAQWNARFEPKTYEVGHAKVTLKELIADGVAYYASADVQSTDDRYLIMPGFADITEPVTGTTNREPGMEPPVSYQQMAEDAGLNIERLSLYIELPQEGESFFDNMGREDGSFTLITGGHGMTAKEDVQANLRIIVEGMDTQGNLIPGTRLDISHPLTVPVMAERQVRHYTVNQAVQGSDGTLHGLTLTRTVITTYADFQLTDKERSPGGLYVAWPMELRLADAQGKPYESGFTLTDSAFNMDNLPDALQVLVMDPQKGPDAPVVQVIEMKVEP